MRHAKLLALIVPFLAPVAVAADTPTPFTKPDGTWISMSGTAVETDASSFTLDYGSGTVLVEMDDWSWDTKEGAAIFDGDEVRVYGEVDDDFAETAKIEASSVYVENLGMYFYASADDEESATYTDTTPIVVGETEIIGTVTSVNGREFTVDQGVQEITVDTAMMDYNPVDSWGYQEVDEGDLVSISGDMEDDITESMELMADNIVILDDA